jgi:hypothetical protein
MSGPGEFLPNADRYLKGASIFLARVSPFLPIYYDKTPAARALFAFLAAVE